MAPLEEVITTMTLDDEFTTKMTLFDDVSTNLTPYDDVTTNMTFVTEKGISLNVLPPWESEGVFVTPEARKLFEFISTCGVRYVLTVIGMPTNVINLIVFAKQGLKDRINVLLFSLALVDLMNLVTLFVWRLDCFMETVDGLNWYSIMFAYVSRINRYAVMVSQLLILLMTVDRCVTVTLPLKASSIITFRRMLAAILIINAAVFAFNFPNMIAYTIAWQYSPVYKRHLAVPVVSDHFQGNTQLPLYIVNIINAIVLPVSVVVVIVLSIVTVVVLKKASRQRSAMITGNSNNDNGAKPKDRSSSDAAVTKMLLVLSFIYVVTVLPSSGTGFTMYFVDDFYIYRKYHNLFLLCAGLSVTMNALNSAVNFFAYVTMSTKFRRTMGELLPCCARVLDRKSKKGSNWGGSEMRTYSSATEPVSLSFQ